ncbi:45544_t:CDS:2, partial [Gigaspora margarita]
MNSMILPPLSASYHSTDKLFQSTQTFANSQSYALVKKRTHKDHRGKLKSGTYSTEARYKQTSSQLIDCKFELKASRRVENDEHNHEQFNNMLGHPISRRLSEQQLERVKKMTVSEHTWIPWKKRFVEAWTDSFLHLGTTMTSRVKGAYATLKAYLRISTGDLYHIHETITLAVNNQKKDIDAMAASERICFPAFTHNNPFYTNVKGMISTYALKKVYNQYQKANGNTSEEPLPLCTGSFLSTIGLPCAHVLFQRLESNQNLTIDDFYEHWWIQEHMPMLQIEETAQESLSNIINASLVNQQNPQVVRTRGCPSGSSNCRQDNSTRRDPSEF